jgi:GR25 family glycosyltransferase involved in LPS biosynthesis
MYEKIYYINLDKRTDRLEEFERDVIEGLELDKDKFKRISAIDTSGLIIENPGRVGCSLSHIKIWQDIVDCGYESALIFEDDFEPNVSSIKFNEVINEAYHVGFGVCQLNWQHGQNSVFCKISENISFANCTYLTSAYLITNRYAKRMLHGLKIATIDAMLGADGQNENIDLYWLQHQDQNWRICTPQIGRQRAGFSDIETSNTPQK